MDVKKSFFDFGMSSLQNMTNGFISNLVNMPFNTYYANQQKEHSMSLMNHQSALNANNYLLQLSQTSPIAQRRRLEDAGFNPALMYGSSVGGMSASFAPTSLGQSTSISASPFSMTSMSDMAAMRRANELLPYDMQVREAEANLKQKEADYYAQKTKSDKYNLEVIQPLQKTYQQELNKLTSYQAIKQNLENGFISYTKVLEQSILDANVRNINAQTQKFLGEARKAFEEAKVPEHTIKKLEMDTKKASVETMRLVYLNVLTQAETTSELLRQTGIALDNYLKEQGTEMNEALKMKVYAEIDAIGATIGLKEQQTRYLKHKIWQNWAQIGINTSAEVRSWVKSNGIPKANTDDSNWHSEIEPFFFAD